MEEILNRLRDELRGRYTVEQELGRGGMAVVYRARDLKHDRTVALKVLRPDLGMSTAADRFLREIRTAAQLNHPHIVPLFDSGTAGNHLFYVMPYVEGETLRERLEREGPLPIDDALRVAREVADALQFAHDRGIVHRDIKPENIFLSAGHAAVADFGIAYAADIAGLKLTETGVAVGTPTYMSPEQATADPRVDGRTDQYALGCVVYEMLSGGPPFSGASSQMLMARHTTDMVPPLGTVRKLPDGLEDAVVRALAKVPADRWPTVRAYADALDRFESRALPAAIAPRRRRVAPWAVGLATTVVLAVSAWPKLFGNSNPAALPLRSIAVLPFRFSGDSAFAPLADGMSLGLTTGLVRIQGLAFPVGGIGRARELRDQLGDPGAVGRKLGVSTVVTGDVEIIGKRVRVIARLINADDGSLSWQQRFDGALGDSATLDLFSIQDDMAEMIVAALLPTLAPAKRAIAARGVRTRNLEALRLLAEADQIPRNTIEGDERALALIRRAIALDSMFADAWVSLADRYSVQYGTADQSSADLALAWRNAVNKAIELDSLNAGAFDLRSYYRAAYEWDWDGSNNDARRALQLSPGGAGLNASFAIGLALVDQRDSALLYARRAVRIDSTSAWAWNVLGKVYAFSAMRDSAIWASERSRSIDSTDWSTYWVLMNSYLDAGRRDDADGAVAAMLRSAGEQQEAVALAATYYRRAGNAAGARRMLERLRALARKQYVPASNMGAALLATGDRDGALRSLELAMRDHDMILHDNLLFNYSPLQGDPRYEAVRRRVLGERNKMPSPFP